MTISSNWFYGNEVSSYGKQYGYVDYGTLAKAFDAVLNNDIMGKTYDIGYWEQESGFIDHTEELEAIAAEREELENKLKRLTGTIDRDNEMGKIISRLDILDTQAEELEAEENDFPDVYQWYIVSDGGARILEEANEIVFYNESLDMYLWGVTHYGTSWDYVLTNIKIVGRAEE